MKIRASSAIVYIPRPLTIGGVIVGLPEEGVMMRGQKLVEIVKVSAGGGALFLAGLAVSTQGQRQGKNQTEWSLTIKHRFIEGH